ncbi:MAG: sugar phosphorylase, partial [Candidatus Neomarinimicrobiota bacterium]
MQNIRKLVMQLYGDQKSDAIITDIQNLLDQYRRKPDTVSVISEKDIALICYGDSFLSPDRKPLQTLKTFLDRYLRNHISLLHLLPFFPYS